MSLFKSSWVTHRPFRDFITTGVCGSLPPFSSWWGTLATVSLLFAVHAVKTTDSSKCMPKKDETYPKTRHQYALVAPKNSCISSMCKTVKAKSGWSQNVNWKYNTCYEYSGWQRDGETKIAGQRGIVYMLAICHPCDRATGARSNQVILLMDKTPGRVFFCTLNGLNGMILPFCLACITLFAGLLSAPHPGLCTRSSGWWHSSSGAWRGGVEFMWWRELEKSTAWLI